MKYIRYQTTPVFTPAPSYTALRSEMDRLFDAAFLGLEPSSAREEVPVDFFEEKAGYVLRAEIPGFRKDEIQVEAADDVLTITGHRKATEKSDDGTQAATRERRVSRALTLPDHVNLEQINASYENGLLTVKLPKREEVKPRQIAIEVK